MNRRRIIEEYFEWMIDMVSKDRFDDLHTYGKLLTYLHDVEFTYIIPKDVNRAIDGVDLRYRYAIHSRYSEYYEDVVEYLDGPCSVLEMMIALAIRCEEQIMHDPLIGDRTGQWFWRMIVSLGLGPMTDEHFNLEEAEDIIWRFLNREYESDGRGGLFIVKNHGDLRDIEIWGQLLRFINTIY